VAGIAQWGVRAMDKITVPMGLNGCLKYSSVACAAAVVHFFVTFSRLCWWLLTNGSHFDSFAKSEAGSRALIKLNCSAAVRRNPVAKGGGAEHGQRPGRGFLLRLSLRVADVCSGVVHTGCKCRTGGLFQSMCPGRDAAVPGFSPRSLQGRTQLNRSIDAVTGSIQKCFLAAINH